MKSTIGILLIIIFTATVSAQTTRPFFSDTLRTVTIDSAYTVTAKRGLDMSDFVNVMINDTAFFQAFHDLRLYSFTANNLIKTYDDDNKILSKIVRKVSHDNSTPNYKQTQLLIIDSGKVFKRNGEFELYTVKMFSYIFMNAKNTDFIQTKKVEGNLTDEEGYKQKLKTLIFNPGKPVKGIPLISDKTEIFGAELRNYYTFTFYYATYQDSIPVFYFKCKTKEGLNWWKEGDTMIKELTTIFDARNLTILGRYIDMRYSSVPFDFNVKMNIEMSYISEDKLAPTHISYDGDWDIPFKKKEICTFDIYHTGFKPGYSIAK